MRFCVVFRLNFGVLVRSNAVCGSLSLFLRFVLFLVFFMLFCCAVEVAVIFTITDAVAVFACCFSKYWSEATWFVEVCDFRRVVRSHGIVR